MDLVKRVNENKQVVMNLAKDLKIGSQRFEVKLVVDTSISMQPHFSSGNVQNIISTVLPIALAFDDDGNVPVYGFHNGAYKFPVDVTLNNIDGFVKKHMQPSWGGTAYAPAINMIVEDWKKEHGSSGGGLLGGIFGKKKASSKIPTYCIFVTDGANGDIRETEAALRAASKYPIYFMTVGAGRPHGGFPMLENMDNLSGRDMDNAGHLAADFDNFDIARDQTSLYQNLIKELPEFCKSCLDADLID